jgi:hypothetical protein
MMTTLKLASLLVVIAIVVPSVAHALELPGKRRLSREQYLAVQPIYFPGFTIIGAAEPLAILMVGALLALTPRGSPTFWLIACAVLAVATTHALYWTLTAPVNKLWLREAGLSGGAQRFFGAGGSLNESNWTRLRDRWERSLLLPAGTSLIALIALAVALVS